MGTKLTPTEAVDLMNEQPAGTHLIKSGVFGDVYRKFASGMWHRIEYAGTSPFGWGAEAFKLEQEREPWALM